MDKISNEILDLSKQELGRIERATEDDSKAIVTLILDNNELQKLDNLDSYNRVENLSICNNYLVRMYGVSKLINLRVLCLNNNGILQIEGLKDLMFLKTLKLSGNNIKSIEHLNNNTQLEYLDLSNNQITFMADISYLKHLKHLNLSRNRLSDLGQCDRYLPNSIEYLGLAQNNIQDLNEISHLVHLNKLEHFTIQGNPCVKCTDKMCFDYRPFVINWMMSLKTVDGFVVSAIESLKAEWLYSQGRGRHFTRGQHIQLCQYLTSTCPLTADALDTEDQRKLRLILSKAQHHQQQLKEQTTPPACRSKIQSPRLHSRLSSRNMGRSPDRMSSSYHSAISNRPTPNASMSMSFTAGDGRHDDSDNSSMSQSYDSSSLIFEATSKQMHIASEVRHNEPLEAASKMVPVIESLMSPDYHEPTFTVTKPFVNGTGIAKSGSQASVRSLKGSPKMSRSAMSSPKLKPKMEQRKGSFSSSQHTRPGTRSNEKTSKDNVISQVATHNTRDNHVDNRNYEAKIKSDECQAAVMIQKMWRGYRSRNLHRDTMRILQAIQTARAHQHIQRLSSDMEATKSALDSERKIQQLQMQAINALWKKISAMQVGGDTSGEKRSNEMDNVGGTIKSLAETCINLQSQVSELRSGMQAVLEALHGMKLTTQQQQTPISMQTDITAVTTPQNEKCSWLSVKRPQSLPLQTIELTLKNNKIDKQNEVNEEMQTKSVSTQQEENNSHNDTGDTTSGILSNEADNSITHMHQDRILVD